MGYKNKEDKKLYDVKYNQENKESIAVKSKRHYDNNKEKKISQALESQRRIADRDRIENPKLLIWRRRRKKAHTLGIEFTITVDDFEIPEYCPILGIKLEMHKGKPKSNSPSLDRINNDLGYIPGNVRIISKEANRMKSNITVGVLKRILDYIEGRI